MLLLDQIKARRMVNKLFVYLCSHGVREVGQLNRCRKIPVINFIPSHIWTFRMS